MIAFSRYPTYTVFLAVVIAMVAAALLFPLWIRLLRVRNIGQQVRADGPQGHLVKQGTPTMGGVPLGPCSRAGSSASSTTGPRSATSVPSD